MGTTLFEQPGAERWTLCGTGEYNDAADACWYDEDGHPITYATRREAEKEAAENQIEMWTQVAEGGRSFDEVDPPEEAMPCTLNEDGSITLEDGTHIENRKP